MKSDEVFDVIVIGGGPAGLTAAQYASRANLKVIVLEKPQSAGALALTGQIENYPGFLEPVSGKALLAIFREQARKFGAKFCNEQSNTIGQNRRDESDARTVAEFHEAKPVSNVIS